MEKLARAGPGLIAINHPTPLEPFLIYPELPHRVDFVIAESVVRLPLIGPWLCQMGCIPAGPGSLDECRERLERGLWVGLCPEGKPTHSQALHKFRSGIYVLAATTGAPVFPVGIAGTAALMTSRCAYVRGGPTGIAVGEPLYCLPGEAKESFLERLRQAMAVQIALASCPREWSPDWRFRLCQCVWVPVSWAFFKLVDRLKPDNIR